MNIAQHLGITTAEKAYIHYRHLGLNIFKLSNGCEIKYATMVALIEKHYDLYGYGESIVIHALDTVNDLDRAYESVFKQLAYGLTADAQSKREYRKLNQPIPRQFNSTNIYGRKTYRGPKRRVYMLKNNRVAVQ